MNLVSQSVNLLVICPEMTKGVFIATQLNSTRRRVELSCVAIESPDHSARPDSTQLAVELS